MERNGDHLASWGLLGCPVVKAASLYDGLCRAGDCVICDVMVGFGMGVAKVARESFSIGAFCSMAGDQDGPIGAVGRDGFLSPKTPMGTSFLGVTQPQGSRRDTAGPRRITYVRV